MADLASTDVAEDRGGPPGSVKSVIVDCDVHPTVRAGMQSLQPYLPEPWRQRFKRKGIMLSATSGSPSRFTHPNGSVLRADARAADGSLPGADPAFLIQDLMDEHGVGIVLLNCLPAAAACSAQATVDESIVLASAYNDFFINEWLPTDDRLRFAPCVPTQDPVAAAEEVRRIGHHKQVAAISLPLINIQMGNRWYWPIYAAAQEMGLPIYLHVTGTESILHGTPSISAGSFDSYVDRYLGMPQLAEASVRNLVFSGTLEKFPQLNFMFAEFGFLWLLPLLWRMDRTWRSLRHDFPWVKRSPIEYVNSRCFFTTQPVDEPEDPRDLERMVSMLGYDQICFSSDYPHWDNDMPGSTMRFLSPENRQKIFGDNARRALRLG